jgi:hypothetical protein
MSCNVKAVLTDGMTHGRDKKISRCVQRLLDTNATDNVGYASCEDFLTDMATIDHGKTCTSRDFVPVCDEIRDHMTVDVARNYCETVVDAQDGWWKKHLE